MTTSRIFRMGMPMTSAKVAEAGHAALRRGATLEVPGLRDRISAASVRLVPIKTAAGIARRLFETG
jgi:hypothetical protein